MTIETVKGLGKKNIYKMGNIHQRCVTANRSIVSSLFNTQKETKKEDKSVDNALDNLFNTMSIGNVTYEDYNKPKTM